MTIRKLGIDPGFGNMTIAEIQDGNIVTATTPSVVGVGTTEIGALSMAGITKARRTDIPHTVRFEGIEYLVGAGVPEYGKPIERMDFNRFGDSPELRALLYATLHRLLNGGSSQVAMVVGLPVEVLHDQALAGAVEREMRRWMLGQHTFTVNGETGTCEVEQLKVDIAQPLATWADWGMDAAGSWVRGAEAVKAPVLVIDPGFNTLDMIVIEGGKIMTRYTGGETLGMRRAAEMLIEQIERRYKVDDLSLHEADEFIQAVVNRKPAKIHVDGQPVDVSREARQALDSLGAMVVRFVEQKVKNAKRFKVILTGGGSIALGGALVERYPAAVVVDDPVQANARGLAKLAQRLFKEG